MAEDLECDLDESRMSLSDEEIGDEMMQGDTWIEELECALLADCDPATLRKIIEGKRIPSALRPDFWRSLLAVNESGQVKLCTEFDLANQLEIRQDCEKLIQEISENVATKPFDEADRLRLTSSFESTITTYVKARPELNYKSGNGWTDILKVLYHLELNDMQLYQMFYRIVDRYIPKDLTCDSNDKNVDTTSNEPNQVPSKPVSQNGQKASKNVVPAGQPKSSAITDQPQQQPNTTTPNQEEPTKTAAQTAQAYHLLRLLIQYHDPTLCSLLDSHKVTPKLYVKDWFCTLFARNCSPQLALLIWDAHFKMADPFLIFFAAIVMVVNASDDLKAAKQLDRDKILSILNTMPSRLVDDDIEDLYYLVSNHYTNTTPRSIRSYSHLFFLDTFGSTYSGNESPEDGQPLKVDLKTSQLTSSLDLSQYLCLPIVPAEIFAIDTLPAPPPPMASPDGTTSSPTSGGGSSSSLRYFLVDCRPAEQYNAGHLKKAFHLDCSLMLREPSSFATAVQCLLDIQRQVVASKSSTGGQHLCFIGSGHEEDDQYVNMVVASFLQKYQKYVSIVVGGFEAIHDYVNTKSELSSKFANYITDHNEELCKVCYMKSPDAHEKYKTLMAEQKQQQSTSALASASSFLGATASFLRGDKAALNKFAGSNPQATMLAQSGASMLDKWATSMLSRSNTIKEKLIESLNSTASGLQAPAAPRGHVSSQDKLGRRYTGGSSTLAGLPLDGSSGASAALGSASMASAAHQPSVDEEPLQEVQIESWLKESGVFAFYKCTHIKQNRANLSTTNHPGYIGLSHSDLWILHEIPHNKGFARVAAKRQLDTIRQITSKKRQRELIIFRYGVSSSAGAGSAPAGDQQQQQIVASDYLLIPEPYEVIRLIKHEIVRIMDENSSSTPKGDSEHVKQESAKEEVDAAASNADSTEPPTVANSQAEPSEEPSTNDDQQGEVNKINEPTMTTSNETSTKDTTEWST